ncbi:flavin-containing amine oxidase [Dictyostelium purpureum]|uniref:Amine oxidase n=1 Tax=Dictyostelium purpureum TaxID=5786 RepID=F0ZWJ7_DICPU|nr:flavin-containing amine oxidase [Dictyostelium purpureum]EGC31688.1 flavin-containing amine oxidase [Dictyostelium purpureum]|eukprot:XP_003291786.1 flavin-containing amine oxidase [Dictyostelium purpureum]
MTTLYDVIVVGGGLAGLNAAYEFKKSGLNVLVLEARDRFGGRTESIKVDEYWFDLGGQWMGGTHKYLKQLCDELGVKSFPQYDEGKHVLEINGKKVYYSGNISTLNKGYDLEGLNETIQKIDELASELNPEAPHAHQKSREYDHLTVSEWLDRNTKGIDAKSIINWFCRVCVAAEPSEVSFLYFLHFIRTAGSYSLLADIHGGAQQDRLIGGSQQISEGLAKKLGSSSFALNSPVRAISQDANQCSVRTDLTTYRAKYVVVAIPPTLAGRIDYKPPMPAKRDELTQRMPMGSVIKTIVIYDEPFWRKEGYSAEAISDQGPIFICYDDSSHDDKKTAIVGFIAASAAKDWAEKSPEERKQAVLECYARWWGPKALKPRYFLEKSWKEEEYSRGCYVGYTSPGILGQCGEALRKPVGRIHWAGTETASAWVGYMEGALESGFRVSKEIKQRLTNSKL